MKNWFNTCAPKIWAENWLCNVQEVSVSPVAVNCLLSANNACWRHQFCFETQEHNLFSALEAQSHLGTSLSMLNRGKDLFSYGKPQFWLKIALYFLRITGPMQSSFPSNLWLADISHLRFIWLPGSFTCINRRNKQSKRIFIPYKHTRYDFRHFKQENSKFSFEVCTFRSMWYWFKELRGTETVAGWSLSSNENFFHLSRIVQLENTLG